MEAPARVDAAGGWASGRAGPRGGRSQPSPLPGESHDIDETFERILVDVHGRPSVFTMGKLGIPWQLDREADRYINATDLGYPNIVDIDPATGRMPFPPGMMPVLDELLEFCPSHSGLKSWAGHGLLPRDRGVLHSP